MGSGLISGAAARFSSARWGVWRGTLAWAVLVAFALQSYVTQTHIHNPPIPAASTTAGLTTPAPADHEALACPLCQAVATAGAFVGPAPAVFRAPFASAKAAASLPILAGSATVAAGFNWRSRAPPQL